MNKIVPLKKSSEGITRHDMETRLLALADFELWQRPRFQRPLRVNKKVFELAEDLKRNGGIMPGTLTLGTLRGSSAIYVVDGFHRIEAAKMSGLPEFIADCCLKEYENLSVMAQDYVHLNSRLVNMRPDDMLRGMEENNAFLAQLRKTCEFIGYDQVRRGDRPSHVVGMSALLRCWFGSATDTPGQNVGGSSIGAADRLDQIELQNLTAFLNTAYAAWRNDPENYRLWGNLNLTMCMWLFRQLVLKQDIKHRRHVQLTIPEFKNCLLSVSAASDYSDYLQGRGMNDRDRSSCFRQLRLLFLKRLNSDAHGQHKNIVFIKPAWDKN